MLLLSDIKQTKVYQEARNEGRQEGRQEEGSSILMRLLSKRFGKIGDRRLQIINQLSLEQLEDLGESLLDFKKISELDNWLNSRVME
jgi:predicted transposase YdaD